MNLKNKKILVTGSAGFIGYHLVRKLNSLRAKVEKFDLEKGDNLLNEEKLISISKKKFDTIFHLAGFSGSTNSNENTEKCFKINTIATITLLNLLVKYSPTTKIILSSSRLEYGAVKYLPVDENHPTSPTSAYGLSKLLSTQMAQFLFKTHNLNVTTFRTSNVYGPHKDLKFQGYNLINFFIDLAKRKEAIPVFGDGDQLRDYLYIDDLIDAFLRALSSNSAGQIYNLGFGSGISLVKMAELIVKIVSNSSHISHLAWPKNYLNMETGSYITDITKISRDLGFRPKTNFENGIKKTLAND